MDFHHCLEKAYRKKNCSVNKMNLKISRCVFPVGTVNKSGIEFLVFEWKHQKTFIYNKLIIFGVKLLYCSVLHELFHCMKASV